VTDQERPAGVSDADSILVAEDGPIVTITLNRPHRLNAATPEMLDRLPGLLEQLAARSELRVLVLTGAGRGFCAGADLAQRSSLSRKAGVDELRRRATAIEMLVAMPQVTIAAVNGPCAGMGLALAAGCDIRIAGESASFSTGYLKVGLSGDFGGLFLLRQLVGRAVAADWYLRPRRIEPAEALAAGFITRLVSDADLARLAERVATELAARAPLALRAIKANLADSAFMTLPQYLNAETARHVAVRESADAEEAATAFLEKREAVFSGR
jgi:2-(1,2-epoxy-1,2-dihydrophenyl)acetyl-CoA isomerase